MKTKSFVFGLFSLFLLLSTALSAQEANTYKHWSLDLKGGLSTAQFGSTVFNEDSKTQYGLTFGLELERTFNPLWGLALGYTYVDYSFYDITGRSHEITFLGNINLSNLVNKYRRGNWQKLNLYAFAGGGIAFFSATDKQACAVLPMGVLLEYNINDVLAVGLSGERRWHASRYMGAKEFYQQAGISTWGIMANIRIKFGATNHVRNTTMATYEAPYGSSRYDDKPLKQAITDGQAKINQLENQLGEAKGQLDKAKGDLTKLKSDLNLVREELSKCCAAKQLPPLEPANTSTPLVINKAITLKTVLFDVSKAAIKPSFYKELDVLVKELTNNPGLRILIAGHTDNTGNRDANICLSFNRANAIKQYLVNKGIAANRIEIKGLGPDQPIASNATAAGRQENRRTEFTLLSK